LSAIGDARESARREAVAVPGRKQKAYGVQSRARSRREASVRAGAPACAAFPGQLRCIVALHGSCRSGQCWSGWIRAGTYDHHALMPPLPDIE
jgi:hypothetical protein